MRSRRLCGELFFGQIHRRDAERAEITQRKLFFRPTPEGRTTNADCQKHRL